MRDDIKYKLRPHYLFNELLVIRYLIKKEPETAYDMLYDFSEYLRRNIEAMAEDGCILLSKEMEHVHYLLELEKRSIKKPILIELDIRGDCMIPARSIILLLEHTIRYSVSPRPNGGTIRITGEETLDGFLITLWDDGIGFNQDSDDIFTYLNERFAAIDGARIVRETLDENSNQVQIWLGGYKNESNCS